jgi:hypothetical protein
MKPGTLIQHIGIAVLLTGLAAMNEFMLGHFFSTFLSTKLNLSLVVFCYLGYLIRQSHLQAGRIILCSVNVAVLLLCTYTVGQASTLLLVYLLMIWLNRALLFFPGILAALADFGLCLISASAGYAVFLNGNGLVAVLWCFLLLQALHTLVPGKRKGGAGKHTSSLPDTFDHALQTAENALQALLKKT